MRALAVTTFIAAVVIITAQKPAAEKTLAITEDDLPALFGYLQVRYLKRLRMSTKFALRIQTRLILRHCFKC